MRQTGHARVSQTNPRSHAICDRCGARYNHEDLSWQFAWRGTTLQNLHILVCDSCLDIPNEQLRLIILPPDPTPTLNARPENYVSADNPQSNAGVSANFFKPLYGNRIGNLTGGGGINAAFDGNPYKPSYLSASNTRSNSSYNNYVGINWGGNDTTLNLPSSMGYPVIRHSLTSFTAYAPSDRSFLGLTPTSYVVQSSPTNISVWGAWTTISSGTTTGDAGESITANCVGGELQFHRIAFLGDQLNFVSIAQVSFNIAQVGEIATSGSS